LRSVLHYNQRVTLYTYCKIGNVPRGVIVADAEEILPRDRIFAHGDSGSVAVFADWFRYQLQALGKGTWVDCDAYMIAPLDGQSPYLMGVDRPGGMIQNGILRVPPDSPMLPDLLRFYEDPFVPSWVPWKSWLKAQGRRLLSGRIDPALLPWGTGGPLGLTALAKRHGLYELALPADVLYPKPWEEADWIRDPSIRLEDVTTSRTVSVHLYNERIKHFKNAPKPPAGSFLDRLHREGAPQD
jgi:hypothetical protein